MQGNFATVDDLKKEVVRIAYQSEDYTVDTRALLMGENDTSLSIQGANADLSILPYTHGQIAERLKIPKRFYDRIGQDSPGLRAHIVNTLFRAKSDKRMVRTIDGKVRAFVSDRFRAFDNIHVVSSLLPSLEKQHNLVVESCTITDIKLYIELTFPGITAEVREGDVIKAGVAISNSEVGAGRVNFEGLIWRLWCTNGAINRSVFARNHVGRRMGSDVEDYQIYKDDTIAAELEAFQKKLRDNIQHVVSRAWIEAEAAKLRIGTEREIKEPEIMVQRVQKNWDFLEKEKAKIFQNLCEGKDYTRYGMGNAITALAKELPGDRAYEAQKIGYRILTLPKKQWNELNKPEPPKEEEPAQAQAATLFE